MIKRFENRIFNERYILITIYLISLINYIFSQLKFRGKIKDPYFIVLLSIGTIFIHYCQFFLYRRLISKKALSFYKTINNNDYLQEVNDIFNIKVFDFISIIYGIFAGFFVFVSKEPIYEIKLAVSIYLTCANLASGLAVFRLIKFMYYTNKWTNELNITYLNEMENEVNFVYGNRDFMVLSTIFYVSICLTSVLFSDFYIGGMYVFTTIFGILIIVSLYVSQSIKIKNKKDDSLKEVKNNLEILVKKEIIKNINDDDYCTDEKIKVYSAILENINKEKVLNLTSIFSVIFSILLAIVPAFTQWLLLMFK